MEKQLLLSGIQNQSGHLDEPGRRSGVPALSKVEDSAKDSTKRNAGGAAQRVLKPSGEMSKKPKQPIQTDPNESKKAGIERISIGSIFDHEATQEAKSGAPGKQSHVMQLNADIADQAEADLTARELMSISASPVLGRLPSKTSVSVGIKPMAVTQKKNGKTSTTPVASGGLGKKSAKVEATRNKPKNGHYPYSVPDPEVRTLPTLEMPTPRHRAARISPKTRMDTARRKQLETDPLVEQYVGLEDAGLDKEIEEHMAQMDEPLKDLLRLRLSDTYVASMAETTEKFQNQLRVEQETAIEKLVDVKTLLRGRALDEGDVKLFKDALRFTDKQCDDLMQAKAGYEDNYEKFDQKVECTETEEEELAAESDEPEALDEFWERIDRKRDIAEEPFAGDKDTRFRFKGRAIDELDDVDHTVARPTLRELVKEYESHQRTHHEEPASHEERMREAYERKFATLRRAAAAMQRDSVSLVKERSRQLIKKTSKQLGDLLKKETVVLLGQVRTYQEDLVKRDQQLAACRERLKLLERKVIEYSQMFKAMNMTFNLSERELQAFVGAVIPGRQATLGEDIARYTSNFVDNETWEEPPAIAGVPNLLFRPFAFYGGYVSLSSQEKEQFAANATVFNYKSIIKDLADANQALETSFDYMRKLKEQREDEVKDAQAQLGLQGLDIAKKERALREGQAVFDRAIADMKAAFADARRQQSLGGQQEREVIEHELALARAVQHEHQQENDQLRYELREAKKIIKIPRLHYKHIEKSDFAGILSQYDRIAKMAAEMEPLAPERMRKLGVGEAEMDGNLMEEERSELEEELQTQTHDVRMKFQGRGSSLLETGEQEEAEEPLVQPQHHTDRPPPTREGRGQHTVAEGHLPVGQNTQNLFGDQCLENYQTVAGGARIINLGMKYSQRRSSRTPIAPVTSQTPGAYGVGMQEFSTLIPYQRPKEQKATKQRQRTPNGIAQVTASRQQDREEQLTITSVAEKAKYTNKTGASRRAVSVLTRSPLANTDYLDAVRLKNLPFLNLQLKTTNLELVPPASSTHSTLLPAARSKVLGDRLIHPHQRQYHPFVKDPPDQAAQPLRTTLGRLTTSHARHGSQFLPKNDKIWNPNKTIVGSNEHQSQGMFGKDLKIMF